MKKILVAILVLALVAPAFAVSFTLTPGAAGTGKLTVAYTITAGEVLRGMALKVKVLSGDATINATTDVVLQANTFNTFIDYAFSVPAGYDVGVGHCLANPAAAGVLDLATPKSEFVVSLGFLDTAGAQAGLTASSFFDIFFDLTAQSVVEVSIDTLRGGIVGDNLLATDLPKSATLDPLNECVKSTAPFYAAWVAWGKPDCWCFKKNCRGDIDGLMQLSRPVYTNDLTKFKLAYNKSDTLLQGVVGGICADNDHAAQLGRRVYTNDLTQFKLYYNKSDTAVPICPMDNYNFWTN